MQTDYTAPPVGRLLPEASRVYLIAEFGHHCFRCGLEPSDERPKMDVDHIIPVARGGGNYYGNFQFLCGPCNSWKGTQIIDFRPGDPRLIEAGLEIIPNEERVRKSPVKIVPAAVPPPEIVIQTVVERVQVPIMIPIPPPTHNCYDALPRLFEEYKRGTAQVASLSERVGKAEADRDNYRYRWTDHRCDVPPFSLFAVPILLFLIATGLAIYFYIN